MATKTYPVGTLVIFVADEDTCPDAQEDSGKIGTVVGETTFSQAIVYFPESTKNYGQKKTWYISWGKLKLAAKIKGQQLLFAFME